MVQLGRAKLGFPRAKRGDLELAKETDVHGVIPPLPIRLLDVETDAGTTPDQRVPLLKSHRPIQ